MKLSSEDAFPIYSSFIGGSREDKVNEITVDDIGSVYVACTTWSTDIQTQNGYIESFSGGETDCFIAKLGATSTDALFAISTIASIIGIICIAIFIFMKKHPK